jgi:hypothetical protein
VTPPIHVDGSTPVTLEAARTCASGQAYLRVVGGLRLDHVGQTRALARVRTRSTRSKSRSLVCASVLYRTAPTMPRVRSTL